MAVVLGYSTKTYGVALSGTAPKLSSQTQIRVNNSQQYTTIFYSQNPRELRAINALYRGDCTRGDLDKIIGTFNSPAVVLQLREKGLEIICELVPCVTRDGYPAVYGLYKLTQHGVILLDEFFNRAKRGI